MTSNGDSSTAKGYLDSVQYTRNLQDGADIMPAISSINIGARLTNNDRFFNGSIDDVRIYNYSRTQKQIMEDMNAGHPAVGSPVGSYSAYWPFDEGAGDTAYDKSVNRNNGDLAGACPGAATCPTWTTNGKFGKALSFDGGDYVSATDGLSSFSALSWGGWFKFNALGTSIDMINKNNYGDYALQKYSNDNVYCYIDSALIYKKFATISDTNWHYVLCVYDGSTQSIQAYLDGREMSVVASSGTIPTSVTASGSVLRIGTRDAIQNFMSGLIDEVKIYPFALSPAEIKEEFNRGASLKLGATGGGSSSATSSESSRAAFCIPGDTSQCDPPVAHWKMDEKTGQYSQDTSGNANTGTLGTGATADSADPTWKSAGSCHSGACLKFDGVDDYVNAGDVLDMGTNDFTISAWVKQNNPAISMIVTKYRSTGTDNRGYYLRFDGGAVNAWIGGATTNGVVITGSGASTANVWHYIVATFDRDGLGKVYIDGVLNASADISGENASINTAHNLYFGRRDNELTPYYFTGFIDDVRIYNYARTAAQIAYDYNRGQPIAHWQMNDGQNSSTTCDGTTSVVRDNSYACKNGGACNTGTLVLGASPATSSAWSEAKYGCGLTFDGVDDYVNVSGFAPSSKIGNGNSFTISGWIYPQTDATSQSSIVEAYDGTNRFYLARSGNNQLFWGIGGGFTSVGNRMSLVLNRWQHVVVVFNSTTAILYVNGVGGTAEAPVSTSYPITNIGIGAGGSGGPNFPGLGYFTGLIDDVRIYNYALTAEQVKTLYNQGSAVRFGPTEGLP
ncbi:MAG: LamG domain-containing protein [Patescibacteria group bacterium]|nr:LamG domain-containing protein [Patescibacteria group bacterium]